MIVKLIVIASAMCVLPLSSKIHSAGLGRDDDSLGQVRTGTLHTVQVAAPSTPLEVEAVRTGASSRRGSVSGVTRPLPPRGEIEAVAGGGGAARGGGVSTVPPPVARAPSEMIPPTVNPAVQGALRTAFSTEAFVPNTLLRPVPAVVNLSYCMLGTAQIAERVFRPLAYFGGAASLTAFTLAGTVDHVPFLESHFTHVGFWIAGVTAGVSVVRMGAPKLVTDLQNWLRELERQEQELQEMATTDGEIDPEAGGVMALRDPRQNVRVVTGAEAPHI
jgi:hypothetical protein